MSIFPLNEDIKDRHMILRDRIYNMGATGGNGVLMVDIYAKSFSPDFNEDDYENHQIKILYHRSKGGWLVGYTQARVILRQFGLLPDQEVTHG